ncbi:MAG: Flp pilus assembly complex ATPase component TadA [Candidatus Omnitrophica bacterium]|nr:Flp pilus assembly complex ATPase component TadA [Candidatus Omnitrophota bacterium]
MEVKTHLKLGDVLRKEGLITEVQLEKAIQLQKTTGKRLGETLLNLQFLTEVQLAEALGHQLGFPFRRLSKGELNPADDPSLKKLVPEKTVRSQRVLPLSRSQKSLTVALTDPLDLILMDNLKRMTGCSINPVIATETDLLQAIEAVYGKENLLKEAVAGTYDVPSRGKEALIEQVEILTSQETEPPTEEIEQQAREAQVVRLVDLFLIEAINSRASDIHIEPYPNQVSIRFRIDGLLQPVDPPSPHLMRAIISRIKILAKMDIAEKRLPQDGGFSVKLGERKIDLRVSTIPVVYGEKVVVRLLDKSNLILDFKEIGMEGQGLLDIEEAISAAYGLIFLTGPTGSGKSTTLYAALNRLRNPSKNIVSIEDPVEYKIDGINQVQAKPQIGLTFAAGLRAFLRQDPDILMVGEVRDLETAEICLRAALTGHLVLSTLHTNDAASAVTRLLDLGIEPFLLSPSLVLVAAQRLVRRLCEECKERYEPLSSIQEKAKLPAGQYYRPKGCAACRHTGYRGRIGIFEVMRVRNKIHDLIAQGVRSEIIKEAAREQGMQTLLESGITKAAAGVTSLEEAFGATVGRL